MKRKYDQVFVNGTIFTADGEKPAASAMAVKDGYISWIGDGEAADFSGEECIDLEGKLVMPGIVDNHFHARYMANTLDEIPCLPPNMTSIEELKKQVKEKAQRVGKGIPVIGWGYDEGKFAEKRAPLKADLDEAAPDNPVIIVRTCCHIAVLNSMALRAIGIDENTPDMEGGAIGRMPNGELNEMVSERAKFMMDDYLTQHSQAEMSEKLCGLSQFLLSRGITAMAESLADLDPTDCYETYDSARRMGMRQRVALYYSWDQIQKLHYEIPEERKDASQPVFVAGIKLLGDGSVSGQTAWCDKPYLGTENYGLPIAAETELREAVAYAKRHGVQLKYHAMGESAITRAVDIFHRNADWLTDGRPSVRIEHFAMPTADAIEKCAESGIAVTMQPSFLYAEIESYLSNIGIERTRKSYPAKTVLEKGILLGFSSDSPATTWADPANPFMAIKGAVTRAAYDGTDTGAEERVDVRTALKLYTSDSQKILGVQKIGTLKEGYHADFLTLDRNILTIDVNEIDQVQVESVYMDGEQVYQREGRA